MPYEAEYLIVAGIAWLRRTPETAWAVTFPDQVVRTGVSFSWHLSRARAEGRLEDFASELELEELAPPFRSPHPALRPLASSHLEK